MPRLLKTILLQLLILNCSFLIAKAQPGALDLSFDPQGGANADVRSTTIQPDGKILVMGNFTLFSGLPHSRIVRLNTNGSIDTSFNSQGGFDWLSRKAAIQPDGKIVVVGDFNTYANDSARGIVRINPDGSRDTSFHIGFGFNSGVYAVALEPDGKILVGGLFTQYNNQTANKLIRLNPDGSPDIAFNSAVALNGTVEEIALQADGKILIGGDFTQVNGFFRIRVARLYTDGSLDPSFDPVAGASAVVFAIAVQPDQKILIGGNFTQYNFESLPRLARLQTNANNDPLFNVNQGANNSVKDILVLPDGNILFAGAFSTFWGETINSLAKCDYGCGPLTDFNQGGSGANETINNIERQADGKILITGIFTSYNSTNVGRIARLYNCLTPAPQSIQGPDSILCSQTITYSVPVVPEAQSYEWTLPIGWTGSSTTNSITVQTGGGGIISVRAFSDSCGWSNPSTKTIYQTGIPSPEICLVTVDSASTHNIIVWEKNPPTTLIDSFYVYREQGTNQYIKVGAVPYDSLSEYHDYDADPNMTFYRYRISALSTCGTETEQSPYHSTIHLQDQNNGNFNWSFYQIEGQPNPVINYQFYKDTLFNGNFQQIGFISGNSNQFTDLNFNSNDSSDYVIDVEWSIGCTPTRTVNTTRSNIKHKGGVIGISNIDNQKLTVFPNPTKGILQISNTKQMITYQLFDTQGRLVIQGKTRNSCDISELENGVYMLKTDDDKIQIFNKIILNK